MLRRPFFRAAVSFGVILILLSDDLSLSAEKTSESVPNVMILMLSGVRNSESVSDPTHQYMPHLWDAMKKEGVFYTDLQTNDCEFHMPAASALVTGINQLGWGDIRVPTIFQYLRKKYLWPKDKAWLIGRWNSGEGEAYCTTDQYGAETYPAEVPVPMDISEDTKKMFSASSRYFIDKFSKQAKIFFGDLFSICLWDSQSEEMFTLFKVIIREKKPKMVEFILNNPESAHYDTFARYVLSLKRADEMIFEIWQMIQNDPFYKDHTYLIVCPDHERDKYYMTHGQNTYNNRSNVWAYIYGPDIKKGVEIGRRVYHTDIFATVAHIMNVETHKTSGKVLKDAFLDLYPVQEDKHSYEIYFYPPAALGYLTAYLKGQRLSVD